MGAEHGYSIDRREMGQLFLPPAVVDLKPMRVLFGGFQHIYSFFAEDNPAFRTSLALAAGGPVVFIPFRPPGEGHIAECYLRTIEPNAEAKTIERDALAGSPIELLPEDLESAEEVIARFGLKAGGFLLILPGSGSAAKNWPADHFASLAEILAPQLPPLVLIGPAEAAIVPLFRENKLPLAEGLELGTVAGLARLARGFIGNDSGVAHLAASLGAPGISIFGPTDPARWRPLGRVEIIRREPLSMLEPGEVARRLINTTMGLNLDP
jgi:hypothetical protein